MKKIINIVLLITLIITFGACSQSDLKPSGVSVDSSNISDDSIDPNTVAIMSYGNQSNAWNEPGNFIGENGWVYCSGANYIYKVNINDVDNEIIIYKDESLNGVPSGLCVYENWIYFISGGDLIENRSLYRVKEDGTEIDELYESVSNYVLTKNKIFFNISRGKEDGTINIMNFDGSDNEVLIKPKDSFEPTLYGIDNGWIYYNEYSLDILDYYRMTSDGKTKEQVWDFFGVDSVETGVFVIDKNTLFYAFDNKLIMKNPNKIKKVLDKGGDYSCLNIDGDWLFYAKKNAVYKINIVEKSNKELVYRFNLFTEVDSISLDNGNALLTSEKDSVYIKEDGEVINLNTVNQ